MDFTSSEEKMPTGKFNPKIANGNSIFMFFYGG